jgi:hemerythrin superfamily protein
MIKADHRALEDVFVKLEAEKGDTSSLLEQVKELLVPHSKAEEKVVYPAIKSTVPAEGSDVDDGIAEHHHVASVLARVMGEDPDDPGADGLVAAIIGEVRHHVEEEENDILPKFAKAATKEQLDDLGRQFASAKDSALASLRASS